MSIRIPSHMEIFKQWTITSHASWHAPTTWSHTASLCRDTECSRAARQPTHLTLSDPELHVNPPTPHRVLQSCKSTHPPHTECSRAAHQPTHPTQSAPELHINPHTHPTLSAHHRSTPRSYSLAPYNSSGARYHLRVSMEHVVTGYENHTAVINAKLRDDFWGLWMRMQYEHHHTDHVHKLKLGMQQRMCVLHSQRNEMCMREDLLCEE